MVANKRTIEQKAKAYDEAIKRAKAMIPVAANQEEIYNSVITIFPELKESEDEKIIERILFSLQKDIMATKNSGCSTKDLEKYIAWLEKQGEQKPAEWSEEDRQMRMKVLKYLSTRCNVFEYEEVENWLKSLRPQSKWRPSIAQLNALSIVSKGNAPDDIEAIVSLYNDLKKLKG